MRISFRKQVPLLARLAALTRYFDRLPMRDERRAAYYAGRAAGLNNEFSEARIARAESKRQRRRERNLRAAAAGGIGVVT